MKNFEEIVKGAIGKKVRLNVVVQDNPPYSIEGRLLEINKDHLILEDLLFGSKIYVNVNFSAILSVEVFKEESL